MLLDLHEDTKVTQEQYFAMLDLVNNKKNSLSKDLSSKLTSQLFKFKVIMIILLVKIFFRLYFKALCVKDPNPNIKKNLIFKD